MVIVGDSHVRRLGQFHQLVDEKLQGVPVDWVHQGGSGLDFPRRKLRDISGYKIVVVMTGGNDLANGSSVEEVVANYQRLAEDLLRGSSVQAVVITSIWPRHDRVFNARARAVATRLSSLFYGNPQVNFWSWDRRQPWRTRDGTHLTPRGYRKAASYLVAAVVWTIHHLFWW